MGSLLFVLFEMKDSNPLLLCRKCNVEDIFREIQRYLLSEKKVRMEGKRSKEMWSVWDLNEERKKERENEKKLRTGTEVSLSNLSFDFV